MPDGGGELPVVFRVPPGPCTRVARCAVREPGAAAPRRARPRSCGCAEGGPYRVRDLARDRDTVLAAYRNAGYSRPTSSPR